MFLAELLVFALIYFLLLRPIQAAFTFTRPPRFRVTLRTPASLGVAYEDVVLHGRDGTPLSAWYVPSRNGAAVLLLHGHSGNRLGVMFHAEALVAAGFGVLMPDLRRHGSSGGRVFGRGEPERDDVLAAVSYLSQRADVNPAGIGVFGVSVGGLFALQAAAQTVAIRAVAADGPAPAQMADLPPPANLWQRLVTYPLQQLFMALSQRLAQQPPLPPSVTVLPRLAQPLLFIASGRGLEAAITRRLQAAAGDRTLLWELPDSSHATGWRQQPEAYARQLTTFFAHTLAHRQGDGWSEPDWSIAMKQPTPPAPTSPYGPIAYDATLTGTQVNLVALLFLPFSLLLFGGAFWLVWPGPFAGQIGRPPTLAVMLLSFALAIFVHEGLHALAFLTVGKAPSSAVKFGFSLKMLAPYAHCRAPLQIRAYRFAVVLPGVVLGLFPALLGLAQADLWLTLFGTVMTFAAGGDFAILLAVRRVPANSWVLDHPSRAGCRVLAGAPVTGHERVEP